MRFQIVHVCFYLSVRLIQLLYCLFNVRCSNAVVSPRTIC